MNSFNFQDDLVDLNSRINQPDVTPIQFLSNQGINRDLVFLFNKIFQVIKFRIYKCYFQKMFTVPTLPKFFQVFTFFFNFYF